ncbi:hypothetical protein COLO4_19766 [Corchorus olitorius]|uniref:Uncharacterized protein n=1 Tax=Corchorus olitorius TaxID=93759 RepID=A0A1R3J3N7_9ROSI|nr:hypothetical protein COLO4_19766 [Corchorus olitorius]
MGEGSCMNVFSKVSSVRGYLDGWLLNELVEIGFMCMGGEGAIQMFLMLILYNAH